MTAAALLCAELEQSRPPSIRAAAPRHHTSSLFPITSYFEKPPGCRSVIFRCRSTAKSCFARKSRPRRDLHGNSRAAPVRMPRRSCQTLHKRLDFYAKCTNISRFFPVTSCRGALCRIAENRGNVLAKWRIRRFWESLGYGIEIELFLVYNIHITQIEVWESKHPRASPRACRPRGIS